MNRSISKYLAFIFVIAGAPMSADTVTSDTATRLVRTKKFTGPRALPGIDFSDHRNYWDMNFSAMMITDTSFYRNANYHNEGDKLETLDITRLAKVVDGIFKALVSL